ncbi:MAG: hypothetical protein IT378_13705 [Sandaracinaceae bacterium]|nr:hypothetical protein [Sandaracinaceae bacterium]
MMRWLAPLAWLLAGLLAPAASAQSPGLALDAPGPEPLGAAASLEVVESPASFGPTVRAAWLGYGIGVTVGAVTGLSISLALMPSGRASVGWEGLAVALGTSLAGPLAMATATWLRWSGHRGPEWFLLGLAISYAIPIVVGLVGAAATAASEMSDLERAAWSVGGGTVFMLTVPFALGAMHSLL